MRQISKRKDADVPRTDAPARSNVTGQDASPQETQEGAADDMIRKVMAEQRRDKNLRSLPPLMPDEPEDASQKDQAARRGRRERRQAWGKVLNNTPTTHYDAHNNEACPPRRGAMARFFLREDRSPDAAGAEEPRSERRYAVALLIASVLVFWPEMIPGLLTMMFWTLFVASLLFGPDRVVDFLQALWRLFLRCHPGLAAKLRGLKEMARQTVAALRPGKLRRRWLSGDTASRKPEHDESFSEQLETGAARG